MRCAQKLTAHITYYFIIKQNSLTFATYGRRSIVSLCTYTRINVRTPFYIYIYIYTSVYYIYIHYTYIHVRARDVWHIFRPVEGVWRSARRGVIGRPRQIANYRPAARGRQVRFATTSTASITSRHR